MRPFVRSFVHWFVEVSITVTKYTHVEERPDGEAAAGEAPPRGDVAQRGGTQPKAQPVHALPLPPPHLVLVPLPLEHVRHVRVHALRRPEVGD